ncbi:MAG: cation:proton antiporter [Candidatus Actinomarinales bacterium]|nr:MAG: cation:proton antiporter [Candidatus Actinomarinales bacterium]
MFHQRISLESFDPLSIIIISLGAFALPLLANRIKIPSIVLEIAYGLFIGPVLGLVTSSEFISGLAILGFFLLMFLSGFEIELEIFEDKGIKQLAIPFFIFLGTLGLSLFIVDFLQYDLFLALVLGTTSVGIVVPILRSDEKIKSQYGQMILLSAIIADFLTLIIATIYASIARTGNFTTSSMNAVLYFIVIFLVLRLLRRAAWWYPEIFQRLFNADDPEEIGIRASLALMLSLVGLSVLFDIEPILGAFLAGTVFALVFPNRGSLETSLKGFSYGFLIPIFFINIGLNYDIRILTNATFYVEVLLLLGLAILVKLVPSFLMAIFDIKIRDIFAAGFLLSARFSLIIAMAEIGVELGLLSQQVESEIIFLAALTATFAPIGYRFFSIKK